MGFANLEGWRLSGLGIYRGSFKGMHKGSIRDLQALEL